MKVFVQGNSEVLSQKRAKKQYDSWSAEYSYSVSGIGLTNEAYFSAHEFELPYDVKIGDQLFVVFVTYSTGDSFGTARGQGDVVAVFKDQNLAFEAAREIRKDENADEFLFLMEDGTKQKFHNVASGYFEHITTIGVQGFIVHDGNQDEDGIYQF
jgi:hypothetical protein